MSPMESAAICGARWVVGKALSPLSDGLVEAWAASSKLGPNIEALKMELLYAQAMLNNARGREIHNPALAELLQRLRSLAYKADDVLDELDYFRIQDELEGTFETVDDRGCVGNLVRDTRHAVKAVATPFGCSPCFSSARAIGKQIMCSCFQKVPIPAKMDFDRVDVSRRMRYIVKQLQPVCAKVSTILDQELLGSAVAQLELLNSRGIAGSNTTNRSITTSESTEPNLYGRDREKNTITQDITKGEYSCKNLTVLPIVGPGGIGKTTLTQYIYNSQQVQEHFQIRLWICVSLDFSVYRLTQEIAKIIPKDEDEQDFKSHDEPQNLDQLQKLVEKRLKSRRFILVLDDVWKYGNEDEWKRLLVPFTKGQAMGNIVLVTSRFLEVAEMVKTTDKYLQLEGLQPDEYWSFFVACVFGHGETKHSQDSDLKCIGKQIVPKLKGSPLAAKTVGRLLRKNLTPAHWTSVLESKEWESQTSDHDIMPALKLSYDYLPFHLQQCFSYCALFPEDYKFDSEKLIRFWIGLDILCPNHTAKRIEDIGGDYLNELVNCGFFKKEAYEEGTHYVIHDLLHDLALKVSSPECLHIDFSCSRPLEISPYIYHLSIDVSFAVSEDGTIGEKRKKELGKIRNILKSENLRTLMLFGELDATFFGLFSDLLEDAKSLRVVYLSTECQPMESMLPNFSKLIHLRYLKFASCFRSGLPISRFYQLRVLEMEDDDLFEFPRDMTNLAKLRHFPVIQEELHSKICNVGKLIFLQELRRFKVKKENDGFELRELGQLEELRESLGIYNLERVPVNEGHEAKLQCKSRLQKLMLEWNKSRSNKKVDQEDKVLENLRPHSNLRELCIKGHGGLTCPTWLSTNLCLKGLETLHLEGVAWKSFPPLGELWLIGESGEEYYDYDCISGPNFQNLKRLELIGLPKLRKWVANQVCPILFSHIEVLVVKDCFELTELPFSYYSCNPLQEDRKATWFPRLRETEIQNCPKLSSLPPIPYTHTLCFVDISRVGSGLEITLKYSNESRSLSIRGNESLHSLYDTVLVFPNLIQLQDLSIKNCPPLAVEHLQMLTMLKTLRIDRPLARHDAKWQVPVEILDIERWGASGKELTDLLSHLPKLSKLSIKNCKKITHMDMEAELQEMAAPMSILPPPAVATEDTQARDQNQEIVSEVAGKEVVVQLAAEQEKGEDGLLLFPNHLSESLQELEIAECPELRLVAPPNDHTTGGRGEVRGIQALWSLQKLTIRECPKLLSSYPLSSSCCLFPSSLQDLSLFGRVERMETLEPLSNLISLIHLEIWDFEGHLRCKGLSPLVTRGQLSELIVFDSPNFFIGWDPLHELQDEPEQMSLSPSSKLRWIWTDNIAFFAAPICSFLSSSLTISGVWENKEVKCFTKEQEEALQLLTSLQDLEFYSCPMLRRLPSGLNKLTNLKRLHIWRCQAIRSLPKDGLPNSLQELDVIDNDNKKLTQRCRRLVGTIPKIKL